MEETPKKEIVNKSREELHVSSPRNLYSSDLKALTIPFDPKPWARLN